MANSVQNNQGIWHAAPPLLNEGPVSNASKIALFATALFFALSTFLDPSTLLLAAGGGATLILLRSLANIRPNNRDLPFSYRPLKRGSGIYRITYVPPSGYRSWPAPHLNQVAEQRVEGQLPPNFRIHLPSQPTTRIGNNQQPKRVQVRQALSSEESGFDGNGSNLRRGQQHNNQTQARVPVGHGSGLTL